MDLGEKLLLLVKGFGVWLANLALTIIVPFIFVVAYGVVLDKPGLAQFLRGQLTPPIALVTLIATFMAQALTLGLCWLIVTHMGREPFFASLNWRWHPQFKWVHAVGLAVLMLMIGAVIEKALPRYETDLEKLLRLGIAVRVTVALLATLGAPIVEEVVYRGILYSSLERVWGRVASVVVVTMLFTLPHLPQYWGSVATITAILLLSVALTLLRALTGRLLPCVATHFIFNGVQSLVIIFAPPAAPPPDVKAAFVALWAALF